MKPFLLTDRRRVILALRGVILALLFLVVFLNRRREDIPLEAVLFLAIYAATFLGTAVLDWRNRLPVRGANGLFLLDVLVILLTSFYLGQKTPEFYFIFFVAILVAAAGRSVGAVFLTTVLVSVVYAVFCRMGRLGVALFSTVFFIHVILFYVMAAFSAYLLREAEVEREEKEETRRLLTARIGNISEYLQDVLQSLPVGILILDPNGGVITINRRAEEILGIPAKGLLFRRLGDVPALGGLVPLLGEDSRDPSAPPARKELAYVRSDGKAVTLGFGVASLRDREGRPGGVICFFQDISLFKEVERNMARQERLAVVGGLAGGIAHEFSNLLGGVQGLLQMAAREEEKPELRETLELSSRTLERVFHTVRNLLAFSRDTGGPRAPCRLAAVVDETLAILRYELPKHRVEVVKEFGEIPDAWGDAHQLGQVFLNLFLNAIQAMPGGGRIVVRLRREGEWLVAEVADTGHGISPEHRVRLFEPFFTTKTGPGALGAGGTGLGLAVSKSIAERHGGFLAVESRSGEGAVFTLRLPAGGRKA
ncbi:MAG: ATP-binding protein [Planctomycetota bacterium]